MSLARGPFTWYCYLLSGYFTFLLNIQGNVIPFLRAELGLSYRTAGLHPSAIAAGMIVAGLLTDRLIAWIGRRSAFALAVAGSAIGALLLCVAATPAVSLAGCALIGLMGAVIPAGIAGFLAELHPAGRDQAFAECGALTYVCAMVANLLVGVATALALGWRAAMLLGVVFGLATMLLLGLRRMPNPPRRRADATPPLPAAYWAYFATLGLGVALEYAVLLWSPAFLEQIVGLSKAGAAAGAAAFAVAMLAGRAAGSRLVGILSPATLYAGALACVLPGFALYWSVPSQALSIVGLFVVGLGVSVLYPLSLSFAVGAAGPNGEAGGARTSLAAGLAILVAPVMLGGLADATGLAAALLVIPGLALAVGACFALARGLQRRAVYAARSALP